MKVYLIASLICFAVLAVLSWGAVEYLAGQWGAQYRQPLAWGCIAGFVVNLAGLPFLLKMVSLNAEQVRGGGAMNWWLLGFLQRLVVLAGAYFWIRGHTGDFQRPAANALIAVYFVGLLLELVGLSRRISSTDVK